MQKLFRKFRSSHRSQDDADISERRGRYFEDEQRLQRERMAGSGVGYEELENDEGSSYTRHRGSVDGHQVVERNRVEGNIRLYRDYFADPPVYDQRYFRRRYASVKHTY